MVVHVYAHLNLETEKIRRMEGYKINGNIGIWDDFHFPYKKVYYSQNLKNEHVLFAVIKNTF